MQCSISTKHMTMDQVVKVPFTQVLKLAFDHLVTTGCEGGKKKQKKQKNGHSLILVFLVGMQVMDLQTMSCYSQEL